MRYNCLKSVFKPFYGRTRVGFRVWSKLTEKEVDLIRDEYSDGRIAQSKLADKYKVSQQLIGRIVRLELW